ncbi:MAG: hypothetical protein JWN63_2509 [Candidatus Acidoferrum typicum]|nr:hypothetical protein [Candidatus Acidoferrum typicum]
MIKHAHNLRALLCNSVSRRTPQARGRRSVKSQISNLPESINAVQFPTAERYCCAFAHGV